MLTLSCHILCVHGTQQAFPIKLQMVKPTFAPYLVLRISYLQVSFQPFILPFDQVNPLLQVEVHLGGETDEVDWTYVPAVQTCPQAAVHAEERATN